MSVITKRGDSGETDLMFGGVPRQRRALKLTERWMN